MDTDHELKMNLSRREIQVLLLHEFRLNHKTTEGANNMQHNGEECTPTRTAKH